MAINLSIAFLFEQVWGYKPEGFNPDLEPVHGNSIEDFDRLEFGEVAGSPYYANDPVTGLEYFLPVTISYPEEVSTSGSIGSAAPGSKLKSWNLPHPVITVSCKKTIVRTPLTERRGTVKELINIEDYVIRIRGIIVGATNEFPEAAVTQLRELFETSTGVSIKNPITDIFLLRPNRAGSDQVVITDLHFPEVVGVKNVRAYELIMESDEPFNLIEIVN